MAIDAVDPDTLYGNCNGGLGEFVNPVPGWSADPTGIAWTTPAEPASTDAANHAPIDPLNADPGVAGAALAQGSPPTHTHISVSPATVARTGPPILLKTTDGVAWTRDPGKHQRGARAQPKHVDDRGRAVFVVVPDLLRRRHRLAPSGFGSSSLTIRAASDP